MHFTITDTRRVSADVPHLRVQRLYGTLLGQCTSIMRNICFHVLYSILHVWLATCVITVSASVNVSQMQLQGNVLSPLTACCFWAAAT